jgi:23S rRNA (guanosine2251-2'-O)-methyltransferase
MALNGEKNKNMNTVKPKNQTQPREFRPKKNTQNTPNPAHTEKFKISKSSKISKTSKSFGKFKKNSIPKKFQSSRNSKDSKNYRDRDDQNAPKLPKVPATKKFQKVHNNPKFQKIRNIQTPQNFQNERKFENHPSEQILQPELTENPDFIYGRKIVLDAIENNMSINKIYFTKGLKGGIIDTIFRKAREKKIVFLFSDKQDMDKRYGPNTQGVVAYTTSKEYLDLDGFFKNINSLVDTTNEKQKNLRLCILDSITDPHNTGAIIRSAYAFGFDAILIPQRNSCLVNSTVIKSSAGAANMMPIVKIGNITDVINKLKEKDFWIAGADMAGQNISDVLIKDLKSKNICLILGSEGEGIKNLVKQNCDFLVKIPMSANFDSLNVSCAGAILFYEFAKN